MIWKLVKEIGWEVEVKQWILQLVTIVDIQCLQENALLHTQTQFCELHRRTIETRYSFVHQLAKLRMVNHCTVLTSHRDGKRLNAAVHS